MSKSATKPKSSATWSHIAKLVSDAIPRQRGVTVYVHDSGIKGRGIVRLVTPAWKTLRPAARIEKVLNSVSGQLTKQEESKILRFSVLTPEEYQRVLPSQEWRGKELYSTKRAG